jgi:hypothetical protein
MASLAVTRLFGRLWNGNYLTHSSSKYAVKTGTWE